MIHTKFEQNEATVSHISAHASVSRRIIGDNLSPNLRGVGMVGKWNIYTIPSQKLPLIIKKLMLPYHELYSKHFKKVSPNHKYMPHLVPITKYISGPLNASVKEQQQ